MRDETQDAAPCGPAGCWERGTLTIPTTGGDETVEVLTHPLVPGLAVQHYPFGSFAVTHVQTGKKVAGPWQRYGNALCEAVRLSLCLDFRGNADSIAEQVKARRDEPVPFSEATSTSGGVTRPLTIGEYLQLGRGWLACDEFPWESGDEDPGVKAQELLAQHRLAPSAKGA